MRKILFFLLFSFLICMPGCSNRSYEDGYSAGYDAGYQAAMKSIKESPAGTTESEKATPSSSTDMTEPAKELMPQARPVSGTISIGQPYHNEGDSKITVHASYRDCVVKLKTTDGKAVLSFFVRAGDTATVGVPPKVLYVYFAEGSQWYGWSNYFGEETSYYKDLTLADFSNYTFEYTLYKEEDGNLSLTEINKDDF